MKRLSFAFLSFFLLAGVGRLTPANDVLEPLVREHIENQEGALQRALDQARAAEASAAARIAKAKEMERLAREKLKANPNAGAIELAGQDIQHAHHELETGNKELEDAQLDVKKAQARLHDGGTAEGADRDQILKELRKIRRDYKASNVLQTMGDLQNGILTVQQKLEALERMIDQTKLGAYLREKFDRAFQPSNLCEAVDNCGPKNSENRKNPYLNENIVKNMFFNDNGSLGKRRGTKGAGGGGDSH